jgi:uncharacterized damage-inducible protein DinB
VKIAIASIKNPQVRQFYALYWPQHQIICDFYTRLADEQFDTCLADSPGKKSDTPRQSLAHILYVQLVYLNAAQTGVLEFKSMGTEQYARMTKDQLLAELERVDQEIYSHLTAEAFDSSRLVTVPWGGQMNVVDLLFFLRDHDILHIGWNLALMDAVNMPRFESLIMYWGP